ncbi:hypothetical protein GCM10027568_29910 [Humibacter soli]
MSLNLADRWVWDSWLTTDRGEYHLFFLHAPRNPVDPERRHRQAQIGHAVSQDLTHWEEVAPVITPGEPDDFDAGATWTGSVVADGHGWTLFYTGSVFPDPAAGISIQTIGTATTTDLATWQKQSAPRISADPRWYETRETSAQHGEAWRDPWVFKDPSDGQWHMLVTARANSGHDPLDRGVIAHATSADLAAWTVHEPLTSPGAGFFHLEVPNIATIEGRKVLLFSCFSHQLAGKRLSDSDQGGIWAINLENGLEAIDASTAYLLVAETYYCGHVATAPNGQAVLIAFEATHPDGTFHGTISDPLPLSWSETGHLTVSEPA